MRYGHGAKVTGLIRAGSRQVEWKSRWSARGERDESRWAIATAAWFDWWNQQRLREASCALSAEYEAAHPARHIPVEAAARGSCHGRGDSHPLIAPNSLFGSRLRVSQSCRGARSTASQAF